MPNFMDDYCRKYEQEMKQFLFLCNTEDTQIILTRYKKKKLPDYIRLGYIALVLGFRTVFLKLIADAEKDNDAFIAKFSEADKNFRQADDWMNEFGNTVENAEAQQLVREYWEEVKQIVAPTKPLIQQLCKQK